MAEPRGTETWGPAGWADDLAAELARRHRGGPAEAEAFARRVPASYREAIPPAEAADDMAELEALDGGADDMAELEALDGGAGEAGPAPPARFALRVAGPSGGMGTAPERGVFRLRRFSAAAVELSGFLPVIESFGLTVLEVAPHRVAGRAGTGGVAGRAGGGGVAGRAGGGGVAGRAGGGGYHVDDFSLRADRAGPVDHGGAGLRLIAALDAALSGRAEVDSLNGLVLAAGLDGREVGLFRAYRRYRRLAGFILPDAVLADALVERPAAARALLGYFVARFDPAGAGPLGPGAGRARQQVLEAIDGVDRLETYQALRAYLALVDATVRTNWFCADSLCPAPAAGWPGDRPAPVVLKFDSTAVPGLGPPRMAYEIFVHGPDLEGVHLRAGRVARGGIRWSDRHDDLRTEVAGLAAAQVKKNAIIVPTGAKGGFSCATGPSPAGGRRAYEGFVAALLQVTDNVVRRPGAGGTGPGHEVVAPPGVVRADGDDPYLVVAADRGTATFSDLANDVSRRYGFWLGDAFASGGASGYDHKAMGITARGVWTAVARHFRQLGVDVATDVLRVAGVGDMSGDVFGNAMLQSRSLLLVAAFDGRHVFLDPDPDPATSYQERSRLAHLAGSTWADYDLDAISAGGGVWSRDVAHVQLSQAATEALGLPVPVTDPVELVSAILEAPVDLLFFGGIGTYVKDRDEADADVGDHANDAVRVGADQLRARVVAEGGNLGITQRARARYSRRGGRINTDFVDNAAGVATSDREVNLKILLRLAEDEGRLDHAERDRLLASAQGDVVADVLRQVDHSVAALDRAVPESAADLAAYAALVEVLAGRAGLDRQAEALPDTEELARRSAAGAGLVRPELAVLLAYAKSDLVASILGSSLPEDPSLAELANGCFPARVGQAFADLVGRHRLYRELVATALAGTIVDQMGIKWAHEASAEAGRPLAEVVACWWTAWQVLGGARMLAVLEEAAPSLSADTEAELHAGLAGAVVAVARAYLVETPAPGGVGGQAVLGPSARIAADRPVVAALADGAVADGAVVGTAGPGAGAGTGPGAALEAAIGRWLGGVGVVDVGVVSRAGGRSVAEAVAALEAVDSLAGCPALAGALGSVPPTVRWARWLALSLLDDLAGWRRGVAVAALRATPGRPAADAVASWLAPHSPALARGRAFVDELAAGQAGGGSGGSGPRILTSLSLASLAVRSLCGPAGSDGAAGRSPVPGVLDDRWPGGRAPEGRWGA